MHVQVILVHLPLSPGALLLLALGREVATKNGLARNLVERPSPRWGCWLLVCRRASEGRRRRSDVECGAFGAHVVVARLDQWRHGLGAQPARARAHDQSAARECHRQGAPAAPGAVRACAARNGGSPERSSNAPGLCRTTATARACGGNSSNSSSNHHAWPLLPRNLWPAGPNGP